MSNSLGYGNTKKKEKKNVTVRNVYKTTITLRSVRYLFVETIIGEYDTRIRIVIKKGGVSKLGAAIAVSGIFTGYAGAAVRAERVQFFLRFGQRHVADVRKSAVGRTK